MAGPGVPEGAPGDPPARVPQLLADQASAWSHRLPPAALKVAVVLSAMVCIGSSLSDEVPITAALVESPGYLLTGAIRAAWLASAAVVFIAPAVGLAMAALGCLITALLPAANAGVPQVWAVVGLILSVLLVADAVTRARQRALGAVWRGSPSTVVLVPDVPRELRRELTWVRRRWAAGATACLLLGVAALILLVHDARAAVAFREDSLVAVTVVDSLTFTELAMNVTIDGEKFRVPLPSTEPPAGQRVEVRYQPRTGRAEETSDVFDPTLATIPGVGGLLVSAAMFATARRRRGELVALLTEGGPALEVRTSWSSSAGVVHVFPCDDVTRSMATMKDLTGWIGPDEEWADNGYDEDDDEYDDEYDEYDDDAIEEQTTIDVSDAELLEMARSLLEGADGEPTPLAPTPESAPVLLVGLANDGGPAALRGADGRWSVSRRGLRRPQWRWPRGAFRTRLPDEAARPTVAVIWLRGSAKLASFARRTGRWLPWAVLPPGGWALRWLFTNLPTLRVVDIVLTCAVVGWSWSTYGQVQLVIRPRWLRVRGRFIDELVAWPRITSVVSDGTSLVLRLDTDNDSRGDALLLTTGAGASPLMKEREGPQEAAQRIDGARADAGRLGARPPRVRWRPAVPLLVGLCWMVTVFLAALSAR